MLFQPNIDSLSTHKVPDWFDNAKFGIFIHWGLFSVPAYAPVPKEIPKNLKDLEPEERMRYNLYAEWYLNSLKIAGSPTQKYHIETYGENFSYDNFVPMFNEAIKSWNPEEMADLFKKVHARYVVLVTKHHDGFLMWHSKYPNPKKANYMASRDIVGELTAAVKERGMIMGLYYSGLFDWSFKHPFLRPKSFADDIINQETDVEYVNYANNHWYELIDRYEPKILWNDIGYSPGTNVYEIFAYFYNKFPEGVIDDRWMQIKKWMIKALKIRPIKALVNWIAKRYEGKPAPKLITSSLALHCDFLTPEYTTFDIITEKKWEANRGIGNSFGYNKFETENEYLSVEKLIHLFVDIVSKNGNLLLNVGPMADGTIPELQKKVLLGLGDWLGVNGEAIFGTRAWNRAEGETAEGISVRFTSKEKVLYAILLEMPTTNEITIKSLNINEKSTIKILGLDGKLSWEQINDNVKILLPIGIPKSSALSLKIQ